MYRRPSERRTNVKELSDLGVSYDEALNSFQRQIEDGKRQWAARLLAAYPDRRDLEMTAEALLDDIKADGVQVNAITDTEQLTLARAPEKGDINAPLKDSLCVLTVGLGEPAMVSDIQRDPFTADHVARLKGIYSWASAPIIIEGVSAGSICALENYEARDWTFQDQQLLEKAANMISTQVSHWAATRKHKI